jgi:hypothetical protein
MWSVNSVQGTLGWHKKSFDNLMSEPGVKYPFKTSWILVRSQQRIPTIGRELERGLQMKADRVAVLL